MTDWAANGTDLTTVPWTTGPAGIIRAAGLDIGSMSTPALAEAVCAEHNAELDHRRAERAAARRGVHITGGTGVQVGDGNVTTNHFFGG